MEKLIVDRVEAGIVVLEKEDMSHFEIREEAIPFKVSEGNVLTYDSDVFSLDESQEIINRKRIFEKQKNIFKNK